MRVKTQIEYEALYQLLKATEMMMRTPRIFQ